MEDGRRKSKRRGKRGRGKKPPPADVIQAEPEKQSTSVLLNKTKRQQPQFPDAKRRKKGEDTFSASSTFLDKMRARLSGGHFRMLNEKLYTCRGNEAFEFFKEHPELFDAYHAGYGQQMARWPVQPVNVITKWLQSHSPSFVVADFGCGNASLAKSVKNKVFSIDLVSADPSVIACDMANTPLEPLSVDVSVFCLSLMGVNFSSYLVEASRVLKTGGWLLIAEVRSRFDPATGGADPEEFCHAVQKLGFSLASRDISNKMFVLFYFRKQKEITKEAAKRIVWPDLKPCLYKRR